MFEYCLDNLNRTQHIKMLKKILFVKHANCNFDANARSILMGGRVACYFAVSPNTACVLWKAFAIVLPALLLCLCPIAALACFQTLNDWPEMLNDVVFFNLWN